MKKQEIYNELSVVYQILKGKYQGEQGMTKEETENLYNKVYSIMHELSLDKSIK